MVTVEVWDPQDDAIDAARYKTRPLPPDVRLRADLLGVLFAIVLFGALAWAVVRAIIEVWMRS